MARMSSATEPKVVEGAIGLHDRLAAGRLDDGDRAGRAGGRERLQVAGVAAGRAELPDAAEAPRVGHDLLGRGREPG